ncbi:MAG: CpaF family protein, partial [Candidatus Omnitrophica bacterium]|nr:CpaF family protein [Candidatus Omnitrophota bacterium]
MAITLHYSDLKDRLHRHLISNTDFIKVKDELNDDQMRLYVDNAITQVCRVGEISINFEDRSKLIREIAGSVVSLGPIRALIEDNEVTEIMINGPKQIYMQKKGKIILTDIKFEDNAQLLHTIQKIIAASGTSRRVDESSPYVDFSMIDGSRMNIILPPCSLVGPVLTIRKFSRDIQTIENLINLNSLSRPMADFLVASVKAKLNIVFCGSTGSGKTTLLNVLSRHIPDDERIITIEDMALIEEQDRVVFQEPGLSDAQRMELWNEIKPISPPGVMFDDYPVGSSMYLLKAAAIGIGPDRWIQVEHFSREYKDK